MIALVVFSLAAFVVWFGIFGEFLWGGTTIARLRDSEPDRPTLAAPRVTIIAAARNEERHIEAATRSLLKQDYPNLEVLIVDDRSSDATPMILERLAREESRLTVKRVRDLPAGWLGKCHALEHGARNATGEWLLFTDADVIMDPTTLRRAMRFARERGLDHLTATPEPRMPSFFLNAFVSVFAIFFNMYALPWRARKPQSPRYVGIGAFNLTRADLYRKAGGHESVRLAVDDDMRLGKSLKQAGARQDLVLGAPLIGVEWYSSIPEAVRGLEKNAFAGLRYSVAGLLIATCGQLLMLWPWLGLPFAAYGVATQGGPIWVGLFVMNFASLLSLAGLYWGQSRGGTGRFVHFFLFPMGLVFFAFIIWRSALITLARGGIEWRGTRYPLSELRKNL